MAGIIEFDTIRAISIKMDIADYVAVKDLSKTEMAVLLTDIINEVDLFSFMERSGLAAIVSEDTERTYDLFDVIMELTPSIPFITFEDSKRRATIAISLDSISANFGKKFRLIKPKKEKLEYLREVSGDFLLLAKILVAKRLIESSKPPKGLPISTYLKYSVKPEEMANLIRSPCRTELERYSKQYPELTVSQLTLKSKLTGEKPGFKIRLDLGDEKEAKPLLGFRYKEILPTKDISFEKLVERNIQETNKFVEFLLEGSQ